MLRSVISPAFPPVFISLIENLQLSVQSSLTANSSIPGLSDEKKVQTPAFTNAVRLYRQAQGQYGTWEMMCGAPSQVALAEMLFWGLNLTFGGVGSWDESGAVS